MQHRSCSNPRAFETFKKNPIIRSTCGTCSDQVLQEEELPTYHPLSYVAKKERTHLRSAENAIHFIPIVLVLCAIALWFFSTQLGTSQSQSQILVD